MFKRSAILLISVILIIWGTTFTNEVNQAKVTLLIENIVLTNYSVSSLRAACTIQKHDDTVIGFFSGYDTGDRAVTYFDITAACGSPTYPFEIESVSFPLIDAGGYQWPVDIDIVVFDLAGSDSCGGPGAELCRFTISCDSAVFKLPHVGTASFPTPCCVTGPVYIGIEYSDNGAGPFPSITFDKSAPVDSCENWGFGIEGWAEWYDFWTGPNFPGYPVIWVDGETQSASCGPKVMIDEVRPWTGSTGLGDSLVSYVEISNTGFDEQNLTGWSLIGATGPDIVSLPSWTIPAGAYLRVEYGTGTDDADFSDGIATYYAGNTTWQFDNSSGEVGLDDGLDIVDFVGWGQGSSTFGSAYTSATGQGIWTPGDYVELIGAPLLDVLVRNPSGFDTDDPLDWRSHERGWGTSINFNNPVQVLPRHGYISDTTPTLIWHSVGDGDAGVLLQIDNDSLFGSPEVSLFTGDTTLDTTLADDTYFWRIVPSVSGGPYPAAVWSFSIEEIGARPTGSANRAITDQGYAPVSQKYQHKDSKLLCIWDLKSSKRPGCAEAAGAQGPWDGVHAQGDHIKTCKHCHMYCTRASIQMVNAKYGGSLTQDEISYHFKQNNFSGPEGDLGHDVGAWPQEDGTYAWALNGAAVRERIQVAAPIPWDSLKTSIDAGRPVLCVLQNPFHSVVFDSYYETDAGQRRVYISDPWPGRTGFYDHATMNIFRYYLLPAGVSGRSTDANVAADGDGDGVMDFDEQHPGAGTGQTARPFHCVHNDKDTEDDQVEDKDEIRNYTFHDQAGYHVGHENDAPTFPDVDMDGLRAENDCDSDNDGDFDGGEDINGDGNNPVPNAGHVCTRETCQFDNSEFCIKVAVDKDSYFLGEPVYIVDFHFSRETHTYHANSTYNYEKGIGCPTKADGSGLAHSGSFSTDAGGHAKQTLVEYCLATGQKYLTVDVLDDNLYSTPDNLDPQTCWECLGDWFHGFHWPYDYPYHNPSLTYPTYDYPVYCIDEPNPTLTTYSIECPWWWWCYTWPPVLDRYWLAVEIDKNLLDNNIIEITQQPSIVQGSEFCTEPSLQQFNFDPTLTLELENASDNPDKQWLAFSTNQWQLTDSLVSTRLVLDIPTGTKFAATPYVKIMAGDSVYGWSPTPFDSIPISVITSCCVGIRGDVNGDGNDANILDLNFLVNYIFRFSADPGPCPEESDVNASGGNPNILDLNMLVNYLFRFGPAPGPC